MFRKARKDISKYKIIRQQFSVEYGNVCLNLEDLFKIVKDHGKVKKGDEPI